MAANLVVLDVDTGTDDTGALWCAATHPAFELVATSSGWGNIGREQTVRNTLAIVHACGAASVPVHPGAAGPIGSAPTQRGAEDVMGTDGLGDCGIEPPRSARASDEPGADAIVRLARRRPGELTLVALAPLSTVAAALAIEPELPSLLRDLVVMGGAIDVPGNVSAVAEANIAHDPIAAAAVVEAFGSRGGRPPRLVPLDVTLAAALTPRELDAVAASPLPGAATVHRIWSSIWKTGSVELGHETDQWPCHDLTAIWALVDPGCYAWKDVALAIDTTTGATEIGGDGASRWAIAVGVDAERHHTGVRAWLFGSV